MASTSSLGKRCGLVQSRSNFTFLLLILIIGFAFGCSKPQPTVENEEPNEAATAAAVNSSDSDIIPAAELADKVAQFESGQVDLAFRLLQTYRDLGDEVTASKYASSLSIQEGDAGAVAGQFFKLKQLTTSLVVCEAMNQSLVVWRRWQDDQIYNYAEAEREYTRKCSN
jgi:hypothetical protein